MTTILYDALGRPMTDQALPYAPPIPTSAARSATASRPFPWPRITLALILLVYTIFLLGRFSPAISEPDDNGYFAQGSLLATTGHTFFKPESPAQYIGMHWLLTPDGNYISRYPPGLAVLISVFYTIFGFKTAAFINPALSILALPALYLLAKRLTSPGWALIAVLATAINPTYLHHALSGDAHMAVTFALLWGTYLLISWSQDGKIYQLFLAGLFLGCIPTIRYPDAIVALGIIVFLLFHYRCFPKIWLHYAAACCGAAIPIIPLLIRNQLLLGAFWRTGYALTNEQTGFGWNYFYDHWQEYIQTILSSGGGYLLTLGLLGITWMICLKPTRPLGIMLALFTVPFTLLYMAYYWAGMGGGGGGRPGAIGPAAAAGTMRFLLPTLPIYILAAAWALSEALKSAPKAARIAIPIVLLTFQGLWGIPDLWQQTGQQGYQRDMLARVTDALDQSTHHGDIVLANNQILQHLDFVRHWKLADSSLVSGMGPGMRRGFGNMQNPDAPSPMQAEKQRERSELYAQGDWQQFSSDLQDWAGPNQKIYVVAPESELRNLINGGSLHVVKRIEMPPAPPQPDRGRNGMFGGGGPGGGPPQGGPGANNAGGGGFFNRAFAGRRGNFGGPGGMFSLAGAKELVIAQWIPSR